MANLLSRPKLAGNQRVSPLYQVMGAGVTTPLLLIGHADVDTGEINNPYHVINMQQAINFLKADMRSPLLRGLLEAYNAGCKDIWLMATAPMSEYVDQPADRIKSDLPTPVTDFYERYYQRLATTYAVLRDHDFYEIVVPIEAPFYDSGPSDFLTQLANFCTDTFNNSGSITLGVMGTRLTAYNATTINAMVTDPRISALGDKGKFLFVTVGEGSFMHPQMGNVYNRSLDVVTAALLATTPLDRAISGLKLPGVISLSHQIFTGEQLDALAEAKLNSAFKTSRGRRGFSFETKILTDNTLGATGSDFWSMSQMRVIATVGNVIRDYGYSYIGEPDHGLFQSAVKTFLDELRRNGYIVNYSLNITMETVHKAVVELGITPLFGLRNILFTVETGPGA